MSAGEIRGVGETKFNESWMLMAIDGLVAGGRDKGAAEVAL